MAEALKLQIAKTIDLIPEQNMTNEKKIQFFIWIKNRIFDTILYVMKKVTTNAHYICKITS